MAYRARNSTGPRPPMSLSHSLSLLLCPLSPSPGCRHSWLPSHLFPSCFPSLPIRFVLLPLARISLFPPALPLLSFPLCPCLFLIRRSSNLFAPPSPVLLRCAQSPTRFSSSSLASQPTRLVHGKLIVSRSPAALVFVSGFDILPFLLLCVKQHSFILVFARHNHFLFLARYIYIERSVFSQLTNLYGF